MGTRQKEIIRELDMRKVLLFFAVIMIVLTSGNRSFAQREADDGTLIYPDGGMGLDLGGGYQTTPDDEVLLPKAYRDPYNTYTRYGPMYGSSFPTVQNPPARKEEESRKITDHVFHEATTAPFESMLWGVYQAERSSEKPVPAKSSEPQVHAPEEKQKKFIY